VNRRAWRRVNWRLRGTSRERPSRCQPAILAMPLLCAHQLAAATALPNDRSLLT